jgi:hypothetical protein
MRARSSGWSRLYRFAGLALAGALFTVGCAQLLGLKEDVPQTPCVLNSDCAPNELCIFRVCSAACKLDKDCLPGSRCLDTNGSAACVSSQSAACGTDAGDATCPDNTVCDATRTCRNDCTACHADQVCTDGVCVGTDATHDPGAAPTSTGGVGGSSSTGGAGGTATMSGGGNPGTGGTGAKAGSGAVSEAGAAGAADQPPVPSCGATAIGDSEACTELPNGTAINFPGGKPVGPCMAGTRLCKPDATFGPCTGAVAPATTIDCTSAADANCNGKADNTECGVCTVGATQYCYDGPTGTTGVGACKPGTQVCQLDMTGKQTVWGPCAGEITPAPNDTCDTGNDATCNNHANEGCTCLNGATSTCGSALNAQGPCAAGTTKCTGGNWGACSASPAASDTCDPGNDANCNGVPNQGCACINGTSQGCGAIPTGCTQGSQTCAGGAFGACSAPACSAFSVGTPAGKCLVSSPAGEPNDNTCVLPVCPAGYSVSSCTVHLISGAGTCTFDGADGGDPTSADITASKPLAGSGADCAFTSCSCIY